MTGGNVPRFMFAPDRETSLRAVSLALLKVRSMDGMTCAKIAHAIGCCVDTVQAASNEETLLSFDKVAALLSAFPDQCATIHALWGRERDELTALDHRAAIERHLAALARMASEVRA